MVAVITTLFEDWQRRQSRLQGGGAPQGQSYIDIQLRVLQFLLQRYENTEVAKQPARFPLTTEVFWNKRALVVHHHLARNQEAVKKKDISAILKRMSAQEAQKDVGTPGGGALVGVTASAPMHSIADSLPFTAANIEYAVFGYGRVQFTLDRIRDSLSINPLLPPEAIQFLHQQIRNRRAVDLLTECTNLDAADVVVSGFRDGLPLEHFSEFLLNRNKRMQALDRFRGELATPYGELRLRVIRVIGEIGTLDDIGLLMDLLALPFAGDELPGEREALAAALNAISETPVG